MYLLLLLLEEEEERNVYVACRDAGKMCSMPITRTEEAS